jgi:cyclic pyranopterin phosphate synthase
MAKRRAARRGLSHLDSRGRARMVDTAAKAITERRAVAEARVRMAPATARLVAAGATRKGDVLGTARLAGVMAAKRTPELIPLCHPLSLTDVGVEVEAIRGGVRIRATARAVDRTGVEMEAMVAAAVAALTVYDMVKGHDRSAEVLGIRLLEKSGGKSGHWRRR